MTRPAGYHGKIPAQGDFIQRGLPGGFVRAWDRWLMEGIAELKDRRGDGWLEGYRTAPLWRFSVPAGTFGDQAMVGVLMASVDRVGRNFPLTIAAAPPPGLSPFAAFLAEAAALDQMAGAALGVLENGASKETLERDVDAIGAEAAPPPEIVENSDVLAVSGPSPEGAITARWLERRYGTDAAVFQSDAAHGASRQLLVARAAPGPGLVARLFEGGGPAMLRAAGDDTGDMDILAPMDADAAAPVVAMSAAATAASHTSDLPPELDPDYDPAAATETGDGAPDSPPEPRPVTDDELDALIGGDPLDEEPRFVSPRIPNEGEETEDDDPIAAILAGGGPES